MEPINEIGLMIPSRRVAEVPRYHLLKVVLNIHNDSHRHVPLMGLGALGLGLTGQGRRLPVAHPCTTALCSIPETDRLEASVHRLSTETTHSASSISTTTIRPPPEAAALPLRRCGRKISKVVR